MESRFKPQFSGEWRGGRFTIDFTEDPYRSLLSASGSNSETLGLLALLWVALLHDTPVDSLGKPPRCYRAFALALSTDTLTVIKRFSSLYDRLTQSVKSDGSGGIIIDGFIEEFKDTPVFKEYLQFFRTKDPAVFRYLSSFLLFGKKIRFEDSTLDEAALRGWLEVEARLESLELDDSLTANLAHILEWVFADFDDAIFLPRHGSGSVAELKVKGIEAKTDLLSPAQTLAYSFWEYDVSVGPTCRDLNSCETREAKDRISRLKFVPKDITKSRSICMEPATLQWAQQGVRIWMEQALKERLGAHIKLKDQSFNRGKAQYGSLTNRCDTIDLSSASDSVAYSLIEAIFPEPVLGYLEATRSDTVLLPDGTTVSVAKYAPMGSALCFPTQCAVYAAVVILCSLSWYHEQSTSEVVVSPELLQYYMQKLYGRHGLLTRFAVYGDDIVCDSRITAAVISTLETLGFTVNVSKSFTGMSAFRESCGGFYLNGVDVTPLRAKFGLSKGKLPVTTLSSLISLANRAHAYGYSSLRRHLIRACLYLPIEGVSDMRRKPAKGSAEDNDGSVIKNPILFSNDPDAALAIYHPEPVNKHLAKRFFAPGDCGTGSHIDLQRDEVRSLGMKTTDPQPVDPVYDWYRHVCWWRAKLSTSEIVEVPRATPSNTRAVWRWTASQ